MAHVFVQWMKNVSEYLLCLLAVAFVICLIVALPWWILLIPVALLILIFFVQALRHRNSIKRDFERDGFTTRLKGNGWNFEEIDEQGLRSVSVFKFENGPEASYQIPDLEEWANKPDWTAGRREEIIRKMFQRMKPAYIGYPPDWSYTPEEKSAEEAEKLESEKFFEQMKKDFRIGEEDSEWKLEFTQEGVPTISRKTPEERKRP